MVRNIGHTAVLLTLIAPDAHAARMASRVKPDTLLEEYFCQLYYPHDHASQGLPACEDVKAAVVSKTDGPLPTLELGDPSRRGLFFLHGWPDSAAEWATQFGGLCFGPTAEYYCVAVTWQNFHPDLPLFPEADLSFVKTIELVKASVEAANLRDPTFVIHDWGAFIGYQFMARYPQLFKRTIAFDIGTGGNASKAYQAVNAQAYHERDTPLTQSIADGASVPCRECARWETAWPYVRDLADAGLEVKSVPGDKPLLFLFGNETADGNNRESFFFDESWVAFVKSTPDGKVVVSRGDHWFLHQHPQFVNAAMSDWLSSLP